MSPATLVSSSCKALGADRVRWYRHNPYGPYVSEPVSAVTCAPAMFTAALDPPSLAEISLKAKATDASPTENTKETVGCTGLLGFKYGVKRFHAPFGVQVGDALVTEGDRGEDLGFVKLVEPFSGKPSRDGVRVLRAATPEDLECHNALAEKEKMALSTMCMLAWKVRCPAYIKDVMYQFDGRKITVIIARKSGSFVDFRRLQRAAFEVFCCRVWCAYLDEIVVPQANDDTSGTPPPSRQSAIHRRGNSCSGRMLQEAREAHAHA
ncbi:hypothetical protein TraAM80_05953 [Trypanosoma rangeli]|uniref:PSP1 C-terminal domain-containing protein n=1 Tax=Trypanosoma rangeli TaxID=5698 RepID=A0A3R7NIU7_TRYRA|nr:uncharacterized protein TraAM80_05953 [Trypanosoma rangeli]RNF03247.1 hypothetical protein TraAM80_05953 [Trypanosoma rangeli]|eukprot:RNF03247.1 hypothetical protein TraAM80_05953 [Trypanosoma rangeli]